MYIPTTLLAQGLPPIQPRSGFDLLDFLLNAVAALVWSAVAALIFVLVVVVAMRVFTRLTPGIDEIDELRKGNMAVATVMVSFIIAVSAVVVAVLLK